MKETLLYRFRNNKMASSSGRMLKDILLQELTDDSVEMAVISYTTDVATGLLCTEEDRKVDPTAHVENYAEETVPKYTPHQFKEHFRMHPEVFESLCEEVAPHLVGERTIPVHKKLLSVIWLLATTESYRSVGDRFGMNKGQLHKVTMNVCHALTSLRGTYIQWPNRHQLPTIAEQWSEKAGIPGVVGVIDGTYIPIPGPCDATRDAYICRKGFPAMHVQVVCDNHMQFIDVCAGNVGSVHDSRVFRNSDLKTMLDSEQTALPPQYHLLGDSAYPLSSYMIVPFKDNGHLSEMEKKFNIAHSRTRVTVEHAIGLLKGKFRRLKYLDMTKHTEIPYVLFAVCVLHNFILYGNGIDEDDIDLSEIMENDSDVNVIAAENRDKTGLQKRLEISHALLD